MTFCQSIPVDQNSRRESRPELFLTALLKGTFGAHPVRVRNLSTGGALVEVQLKLRPGEEVQLIRAHHAVRARVAWASEGRAGLNFDKAVDIKKWVPSLDASHQMAVDRQLVMLRNAPDVAQSEQPLDERSPDVIRERVAEETAALSRQIEICLDELAAFAPLVVRLPGTLQQLEKVSQTLDHLAQILVAEDPQSAVRRLGIQELKRRLLR